MTNLQNPTVNIHQDAIEIDKIVDNILLHLDTNLSWLSHGYARAYRHIDKKDKLIYFPEIYTGVHAGKPSYYRATPDNDKSGMAFFVVGKGQYDDDNKNGDKKLYITHRVGVVFWANMKLINEALLQTDDFTQHLIRDARAVLLGILGEGYRLKIIEECRDFNEIYKEFSLVEDENYLMAPYTAFRLNVELSYMTDCVTVGTNRCEALNKNIALNEKLSCILPTLDFSNPTVFNALSEQQKTDLSAQLCP